jgi:hypothetical protein
MVVDAESVSASFSLLAMLIVRNSDSRFSAARKSCRKSCADPLPTVHD